MQYKLSYIVSHTHAFSVIGECFHTDVTQLFKTNTQATLTTPHGVLAWWAVHASWLIRCAIKRQQAPAPPWAAFLSKRCPYLAKWAVEPHRFITTDQLTLFLNTLEVHLEKFYIPPITLSRDPPAPPPMAAQQKAANGRLHKLQRAEELETELAELRKQDSLLIFTDGSS